MVQSPVVQKVDSIIHLIKDYLLDSAIERSVTSPYHGSIISG